MEFRFLEAGVHKNRREKRRKCLEPASSAYWLGKAVASTTAVGVGKQKDTHSLGDILFERASSAWLTRLQILGQPIKLEYLHWLLMVALIKARITCAVSSVGEMPSVCLNWRQINWLIKVKGNPLSQSQTEGNMQLHHLHVYHSFHESFKTFQNNALTTFIPMVFRLHYLCQADIGFE